MPAWTHGILNFLGHSSELPATIVRMLGLAVIAVVASRARGGGFTLGLSAVIDVALDVVNWMREGPLGQPPRARICGRFYSLLKHLGRQGADAHKRPYDAVIIVAHSQGTIIAAETLHYLHHIGGLPLHPHSTLRLFTMGSPLRQLYARRFPHLYGWVVPTAPGPSTMPEPAALGLTTWWNAYRSGDYVGRGIWWSDFEQRDPHGSERQPENDQHFTPAYPSFDTAGCDFCIGPGAHTHYWDETTSMISDALDALIAAPPATPPALSKPSACSP